MGTCYKEKALYKVRDHEGVEFFDGVGWNPDKELLKHLCRTDESPKNRDLFKQLDDEFVQAPFRKLMAE